MLQFEGGISLTDLTVVRMSLVNLSNIPGQMISGMNCEMLEWI